MIELTLLRSRPSSEAFIVWESVFKTHRDHFVTVSKKISWIPAYFINKRSYVVRSMIFFYYYVLLLSIISGGSIYLKNHFAR